MAADHARWRRQARVRYRIEVLGLPRGDHKGGQKIWVLRSGSSIVPHHTPHHHNTTMTNVQAHQTQNMEREVDPGKTYPSDIFQCIQLRRYPAMYAEELAVEEADDRKRAE